MKMRLGRYPRHLIIFAACLWVSLANNAQAQSASDASDSETISTPAAAAALNTATGDLLEQLTQIVGVDYSAWEDTAKRTEMLLLRNQARPFAIERQRAEIAAWRDIFADAMGENSDRLETVASQIAALGPLPADGETEASAITERREALIDQRDTLAAPGLLAAEAHARASGMIREAETQLRDRQNETLMAASPTPLNPANWPPAISQLWTGITEIGAEFSAGLAANSPTADDTRRLSEAILALGAALFLFVRGRSAWRRFFPRDHEGASQEVYRFLDTVAEALIPLIGLVALTYGIATLDIFGRLAEAVLATVPMAGGIIILSGWLGRQFFPSGDNFGPLQFDAAVRVPAQRVALLLAWLTGLSLPFDVFLSTVENANDTISVLNFPVIIVLSVVLFRLATLLRHAPSEDAGPTRSLGRTRRVIGRLVQGVALVSPVLAATGYLTAAEHLVFPTILTLGVLGVLIYLQALTARLHEMIFGQTENDNYGLIPVFTGFVLLLLSGPILALIWGVRTDELIEYWVRFTEGVQFGETRISPSDFMWFIVIFTVGYLLTQFVKSTLKMSVLPRTKLDLGAQNAIVAGFGYVGVFLAGVIAITSAGIDLSNLAIVAGALSVGIGFGLQNIVSNFVSGIILLIERPISEGDWIEVGDRMGYVRDISVRSTRIETFDQTDVIVPNADLVSNQVINWTRGNLVGRLIINVGVAYGTDTERVLAILKDIAESHPIVVMSPPPAVLFMNFGADALDFEIRAILRDITFVNVVRSEMNGQIAQRFAEAGIEIPFAQRDIWLRNPEVLGQPVHNDAPKAPPNPASRTRNDLPDEDDLSDFDDPAFGGDGDST